MPSPIERAIASVTGDNRILAAGVAGVGVFIGAQYWRKRIPSSSGAAAPVVIQGDGVPADQLAGYLSQFTSLGAGAAASGFNAGAELGAVGFQQGASIANTAVDVLGGAVGALAGSQGAALGAGIDALGSIALGAIGSIGLGGGSSGGGHGGGLGGGQGSGGGGSGSGSGGSGGVGPPVYVPPPITTPPIGGGGGVSGPPVPVTPPTGSGPAQTIATFRAPTLVYDRHNDGHIGDSKQFGQAGLRIRVNSVIVPRDSHGGGTFWEMKEGAAVGWLIRPSDPNVTFSSATAPVAQGIAPNGALVPVGGTGPGNGPYTPGGVGGAGGGVGATSYDELMRVVAQGPSSFTAARQDQYQTRTDLQNANPNNPGDVAFIAADYYRGDTNAARRAIQNVAAETAGGNAFQAGQIVGNTADPVTGYTSLGSIQAALASGRAHYA